MSSSRQPRATDTGGSANGVLDEVDRRLLTELALDPRQSKSALGRRVGLSTPTASSRIARLERLGVIRGYRLDIDHTAIGFPIMAWVRLRPGPGQIPKIAELAQRTPEVTECHRITGEDCFIMRVHAPTLQAVEQILDKFLLHGQTTTAIAVSSPVPQRSLQVPAASLSVNPDLD
ncbi:MAG: Lrp/AsnC family transcriptional regulator, leucine-responsive regulatory protein [Mycobacterium sp.]|nr:Lrp/AsnC family transcriptional regulator, leucine-responsive regulatory protein [Mycobacterium sp.]